MGEVQIMENILEVKNLTKKFKLNKKQMAERKTSNNYLTAVDDLSFELKKGEIYGLLGPNGAGKTTTLRMLATILTPTSGKIEVDGLELEKNASELRKKIGFLTSELKLDEFFTPSYTFDFFASLYSLDEETKNKRKEELFNSFEINEFKDTKISNLSTGMKQKVSLAISLVHDPELIIFDEPTNGLDIITSKVVEDYLLNLRKQGKAIIISTHIFSLVEKLCDRVSIIIKGKKMLEGDLKEITKEKCLEDVFFNLYDETQGE